MTEDMVREIRANLEKDPYWTSIRTRATLLSKLRRAVGAMLEDLHERREHGETFKGRVDVRADLLHEVDVLFRQHEFEDGVCRSHEREVLDAITPHFEVSPDGGRCLVEFSLQRLIGD